MAYFKDKLTVEEEFKLNIRKHCNEVNHDAFVNDINTSLQCIGCTGATRSDYNPINEPANIFFSIKRDIFDKVDDINIIVTFVKEAYKNTILTITGDEETEDLRHHLLSHWDYVDIHSLVNIVLWTPTSDSILCQVGL